MIGTGLGSRFCEALLRAPVAEGPGAPVLGTAPGAYSALQGCPVREFVRSGGEPFYYSPLGLYV